MTKTHPKASQLDLFNQAPARRPELVGPPRPRNPYQQHLDRMRAMWAADEDRARARAQGGVPC